MKAKRKRITITIPKEKKDLLQMLAKRDGMSMNAKANELIRQILALKPEHV